MDSEAQEHKQHVIKSFKELMTEITYSWEYPTYDFHKLSETEYCLNKLYISPTKVCFKTDTYILAPGVWEDFLAFIFLLEYTERKESE